MTESSAASKRRALLADSAITTLANAGLRGLTHRAVDREAGLAEGSTSYYFRTRQALLLAAVDRLLELDELALEDRPVAPSMTTVGEATPLIVAILQSWVTVGRDRMLARYELALEATRNPELSRAFIGAGAALRARTQILLETLGAPDPAGDAPLLAAYLDGLIFDHLAGAGALALTADQWHAAVHDLLGALTIRRPGR